MNATGWPHGLEVTGGGTGAVPHAWLALLRQPSDRTGLTSGLPAAPGGDDQGRVLADLAWAIADGGPQAASHLHPGPPYVAVLQDLGDINHRGLRDPEPGAQSPDVRPVPEQGQREDRELRAFPGIP